MRRFDLQVLAWTIEGQDSKELKAFSRNAFQKIGGIEGLMTRFLNEILKKRITESQKQAAIKVLLAMTDLDRNVRVGALTIEDLQQKMQGTLSESEISEATLWLANPGVRLLTLLQQNETELYELAHERLIPALREVAGKELTSADKANQLLDRRVNEWLGNQRSSRYLFNWQELRFIGRQKPFLVWGVNQRNKEELLQRSWRRLRLRLVAIGMALVFGLVGMGLWYSPGGQIQQVRWKLSGLSKRVSYEYREKAAIAFLKDGNFEKVLEIAESITDLSDKAGVLTTIAETIGQIENFPEAAQSLELAISATDSIPDSDDKALVLTAIAETYGKIENFPQAARSLELAIAAADSITNSSYKAGVLREIAETYGKIENFPQAARSLELAIAAAQDITDSSRKAGVLTTIIPVQAKLDRWREAHNTVSLCPTDECKVESLYLILTAWAEKKNPELKELASEK